MTNETTSPLNQGQQAAADGFFQFLFEDSKELIISGPGGVGKTFLMGYMIDTTMPRYAEACALMGIKAQYTEVVMTATTNKAAEVLGIATGRPASTIHSFLALKVQDDYATGKSLLTKTREWRIHHNKIIFIDEASMIDKALLDMIREGTCNCKIIYVGDHCQLAPIQEPISPIYKQRLPFFELTEPMRTGIPALQNINLQLRHTVETGEFFPIQIVPGVIDLLDDDQMETAVNATFLQQNGNDRVLAYTNQRVVDYNNHIREIRQIHSTYVLGEILINNNVIRLKNGMLSVEEELTIARLEESTEYVEIEDGVQMEVRYADLRTGYGETFFGIPLPEDKGHFTALIKHYQRAKNWNRYFHLKNTYPDLRPRDAATIHKAQGSTYDTVFVDLGNLSSCHNPNQAARLLYVAFSRARSRVVLYGELAPKYGGVIQ